jgi:hypothetical protein
LLDDLDPDIMSDLEVRVREKQVERLPISKGEVLLRDLATKYPNLENDILEEREAKRFIPNLGTSLSSPYVMTSVPTTPIESKHPSSKTSSSKKARRSATNSPLLRPGGSDLIFDMDDDLDVSHGSPTVRHSHPPVRSTEATNLWRDVNGRPLKDQPPVFSSHQRFNIMSASISADITEQDNWNEVKSRYISRQDVN